MDNLVIENICITSDTYYFCILFRDQTKYYKTLHKHATSTSKPETIIDYSITQFSRNHKRMAWPTQPFGLSPPPGRNKISHKEQQVMVKKPSLSIHIELYIIYPFPNNKYWRTFFSFFHLRKVILHDSVSYTHLTLPTICSV